MAPPFNPKWIPIATNGAGDYQVVDLAPATGGRRGQIVEWRHETDERRVVASSLEAYLTDLADGLESGRYVIDDSGDIVRARGRAKKAAKDHPAVSSKRRKRALTKHEQAMIAAAHAPGPVLKDPEGGRGDQYADLLRAIDPRLQHFGPCREPQRQAIWRFGGRQPMSMFYEHYAPRGGYTVNGIRFLSIEEMADATAELGVEQLVVMAVDDALGSRFAFDTSRIDTSLRAPIIRIPPGVTPPPPRNKDPFKKDKALDAVAPDAAAHIGEFLKKLASPKHRLRG